MGGEQGVEVRIVIFVTWKRFSGNFTGRFLLGKSDKGCQNQLKHQNFIQSTVFRHIIMVASNVYTDRPCREYIDDITDTVYWYIPLMIPLLCPSEDIVFNKILIKLRLLSHYDKASLIWVLPENCPQIPPLLTRPLSRPHLSAPQPPSACHPKILNLTAASLFLTGGASGQIRNRLKFLNCIWMFNIHGHALVCTPIPAYPS